MVGLPLYSKTLAKFKSLLSVVLRARAGDKIPQIGEFVVPEIYENPGQPGEWPKSWRDFEFQSGRTGLWQ